MSDSACAPDAERFIHAVGIGPGAAEDITLRAARILREADVVYTHVIGEGKPKLAVMARFVDGDRLEPIPTPPRRDWLGYLKAFEHHAGAMADRVERGDRVAFACLGDVGVSSCASFLDLHLERRGIGVRYVPGLSYFNAASSAIDDLLAEEGDRLLVSRCPDDLTQIGELLEVCDTLVLYTVHDLVALRDWVRARKVPYARVAIDLGRPRERHVELRKAGPSTPSGAAIVVLKNQRPHVLSTGGTQLNRDLDRSAGLAPTRHVYREVDGAALELRIFSTAAPGDPPRPGIVLFHGGGWKNGHPRALAFQCRRLAMRGMVAATAEYRVKSRFPDIDAHHCADDARHAFDWMVANAASLGLDPERLAIGGGSSGGHIALCRAMGLPPGQPDGRSDPRALVLLNPVTDLGEHGFRNEAVVGPSTDINPVEFIRPGLPPTLVLHGTDDRIVPFENSRRFTEQMRAAGNDCTLVGYEGRGHAFFNPTRSEFDICQAETQVEIERFLESQGLLDG